MQPRIHDKYLLRQFLKILFFSVLSFTIIYVVVDVFEEIDNFIDHEANVRDIVAYYFHAIPFALTYIIPVSLLLATVFAMGIMGRRNELTALVASGVSLARVAAPIFCTALLVSLGSVYFNDIIVPRATTRAEDIMKIRIEGRSPEKSGVKENVHYVGEDGFVFLADSYSHRTLTLYDVVIQQFDENTLVRRVDARRMEWTDSSWVFVNGFDRVFSGGNEQTRAFERLEMHSLKERPKDFAKEVIEEENMTYSQLREYIAKVRRSGGNVQRYLVNLYFKFSFPFAGSIFVLIGIAFASGKRKQSIATGFGVTLLVAFLYYAVLRIGQTLGHNGVLPPMIAAQLGNIVFLAIGMYLLVRANR